VEEVRDLAARAGFTRLEVLRGEDAGIAADRLLVIAVAEPTGSASTLL
jgi:hypothetical protein